jgi:hypothetical protein
MSDKLYVLENKDDIVWEYGSLELKKKILNILNEVYDFKKNIDFDSPIVRESLSSIIVDKLSGKKEELTKSIRKPTQRRQSDAGSLVF